MAANLSLTRPFRPELVSDPLRSLVFDGAANGIVVLDDTGAVVDANPAFCEAAGMARKDLLGTDAWALVAERQPARWSRRAEASLDETRAWAGQIWLRRSDGGERPYWVSIRVLPDDTESAPLRVAVWTDIEAIQDRAVELERLAYYDPLTGLPNRILFRDRLLQAILHAQRSNLAFAVLYLDLDQFKRINDTLGHRVGDGLLVEVGRRLNSLLRASDTVSRLGGDEFTVILPDLSEASEAGRVAAKILDALGAPLRLQGREVSITTSLGIALYPDDARAPDDLLHQADSAMYEVKQAGRNGFRFFSRHAQTRSMERMTMEQDLRRAFEREEFELHYQPLVDLRTGEIRSAEALVRWRHPRGMLVPPSRFLPVAEQTRLIVPLGEWVMRRAFDRVRAWRDAGLPPIVMAVNLAAQQLDEPGLADRIARLLIEMGLDPSAAELEITESSAMRNPDATCETLLDLKALGIRVAIDDFGTGYSSLDYLHRFPIAALKIDRSFVRGVPEDSGAAVMATAIIGLGHNLQLQVVAEGVENREQLDFLKEHDCDQVQGFFCSRPLPEESFLRLLAATPRLVTSTDAPPPRHRARAGDSVGS